MKTSTRLKKIAVRIAVVIAAIVLLFMLLASYRVRDRHPGYHVDLTIKTSEPGRIMAGFSALSITPVIEDTWNDVDGNAKYETRKREIPTTITTAMGNSMHTGWQGFTAGDPPTEFMIQYGHEQWLSTMEPPGLH